MLKCFVGLMSVGRAALCELYPPEKNECEQVKLMVGRQQLSALYMVIPAHPRRVVKLSAYGKEQSNFHHRAKVTSFIQQSFYYR